MSLLMLQMNVKDIRCIALDAMGVIYRVGDDVKDLLYPFILEKRGPDDFDHLSATYLKASLGEISARDFWNEVGLDASLEDEYLRGHRLNDGLLDFLQAAGSRGIEVWCLSNDLAEWSAKLRRNFKLHEYFKEAVISGAVRLRKPDPAIYDLFIRRSGYEAGDIVFIDDNVRNLDSAAGVGLKTILFDPLRLGGNAGHVVVCSFEELRKLIFI